MAEPSPMKDEAIPGITDAIQAAAAFLTWARHDRDHPTTDGNQRVLEERDVLIAKLQALGPVGEG